MNVNAGFSHIHNQVPPIAARTQTATIQMTVCAKQNLAVVANLANNTLSQAGRLTLLYCIRFVFALLHSFRIVWKRLLPKGLVLKIRVNTNTNTFFMLYCKISTNNIINNAKGSHENRLAYDCPGNVMKLTSTQQCLYQLTHFRNIY